MPRIAALDRPIGQPWVEAAAHSVDLVVAAPQGQIVFAVLPALVALVAEAVAVDSAVVDVVRCSNQRRMK